MKRNSIKRKGGKILNETEAFHSGFEHLSEGGLHSAQIRIKKEKINRRERGERRAELKYKDAKKLAFLEFCLLNDLIPLGAGRSLRALR
jgi:hypothetical protein